MGQKITEYPSVDNWVKLMRERDAALHKFPDAEPLRRRPAKDAKEWDQYGEMQRARTRTLIGVAAHGDQVWDSTVCLSCGIDLGDMVGAFLKRQIYTDQGRTDFYLCAACAGK